jgi:hypothetical protein
MACTTTQTKTVTLKIPDKFLTCVNYVKFESSTEAQEKAYSNNYRLIAIEQKNSADTNNNNHNFCYNQIQNIIYYQQETVKRNDTSN